MFLIGVGGVFITEDACKKILVRQLKFLELSRVLKLCH